MKDFTGSGAEGPGGVRSRVVLPDPFDQGCQQTSPFESQIEGAEDAASSQRHFKGVDVSSEPPSTPPSTRSRCERRTSVLR